MITFNIHFPNKPSESMFIDAEWSLDSLIEALKYRGTFHRLNFDIDNYDVQFNDSSAIVDDAITGERVLECRW